MIFLSSTESSNSHMLKKGSGLNSVLDLDSTRMVLRLLGNQMVWFKQMLQWNKYSIDQIL